MMTIQKPKRTWQKKKDYMRKKTIRGLRRKGKRILQSFDDGTDDKKYYLYDTPERLHDSNAIIEYPEAKDGPVITLQGSYPSIQEYYLGKKWRGGASPFGTIQYMQDFLTDRDFARFANATRAYGNGEGISGFWNGLTDNPDYTGAMEDPGTAFLMKPARQAAFLNKLGYIEDARPIGRNMIKGPYEALYNYTGKYIPTYRKGWDDEQPENVESISDTDVPEDVSKQKSPEDSAERSLVHAGYYPTGYFKSKEGDKYYQMDIDLNDYGQHEASDAGGAKSAYKQDARSTIANLYDYFGNPFVQRSGLRKLAGKPSHDNGKDYFDIGTDSKTQQISSTQRIVGDDKHAAYIEDSSKPIALTNDPNTVIVQPNVFINNDTGEYTLEKDGESYPLSVYDKNGTEERSLWTFKLPDGRFVVPHKYNRQITITPTKEPELELTYPEFDILFGGRMGDLNMFKMIRPSKSTNQISKFKSELDWSPESWFKTRVNGKYDAKDVAALESHIPEYLEIERATKANGTWLKMPDGSTWPGDARSWVQMMSKAYDKYTGKSPFKYQPFSHSTVDKFDTFDLKHFGKTDDGFYGKGFYTHPAENINGKLIGRNNYGDVDYLLTTNVQKPFDLTNPNFKHAGQFNWENTNAPEGIFDGFDSVYYGIPGNKMVGAYPSELVVPKPSNYKSLLGNNGDFNPNDDNMYRILLPLVGISGFTRYENHNSGKDIHIKKTNRGKFTEAANEHNMGVQEFARQVLSAPKGKYSSTLRKRANFARNFAH